VNDPETEKPLRTTSFVIHATRGLIRDQTARRKTMFVLLVVALVLLFAGSTLLRSILNPRAHPVWFILYWLVCGWLTVTAMLLALFDLLVVRAQARKAEGLLHGKVPEAQNPDSPRSTIDQ
jgi:protein-S-isoprenylcysteine O-methyltransferase Ste14